MAMTEIYLDQFALNSRHKYVCLVDAQSDFVQCMFDHCTAVWEEDYVPDNKGTRGLLTQLFNAHGVEPVFVVPLPKGKGGKS